VRLTIPPPCDIDGKLAERKPVLPPSHPTEADIRDWCVRCVANILEVPVNEISAQDKFARLGLDSASSVHLVVALEEWLGIEIAPETVADHPTIAALARHVAAQCGGGKVPR
jgi:phthiocerol/phenolphthiocerol synthesis type-I polyketide synthase D